MSLKIVFAGTPQFAVPTLRALIDSSHRVLAVYTQPDRPSGRGQKIMESPVKEIARQNEIPIIQPFSLRDEVEQEKLIAMNADVMVVVAYGLILPKKALNAFRLGCVNVHASLLPRWRGAAPIQRAILAGDRETGISIMQMNEGLDTGDVLAKSACVISSEDTAADLHDRLSLIGADLLLESLAKLEKGDIKLEKQDEASATYASKIQKQEALINWRKSAVEIARQVRAFNPTPIAFTYFEGQPMRIWRATVVDEKTDFEPGVLVDADKKGISIAAGSGILRLHQLQLPGKRVCSAGDFINAHGDKLIPGKTVFG
ncbi:methionyl-tRNA formyltransferase [Coxiella burnetii]|uniref:methionyl-tRNA formyltransferase n=1 Tax=Coxiella burnetii TaxID=777 RepID=UPI000163A1BD|nr:methionyl-tRNA formyltransferase [Coxiella burnetii]AIT64219.1 Methionyl-tRNA formyltransferase [Coxiella burnetii str. Namibia]ATN86702.1 methionyl-tRNA formyltransferase [Coxiella burnetii str. Schperling]EDR36627.1 methionyl-tRNA formyltransferase [Coxiella burnetii Q321]PHH57960.1 methionyl-tRNA formyltransferase [Coxiella burnetii]